MKIRPALFVGLLGLVAAPGPTHAASFRWLGPNGAAYETAIHWDPDGIPGLADIAVFNSAGSRSVGFFTNRSVGNLLVGTGDYTFQPFQPDVNRTYTVENSVEISGADPVLTLRAAGLATYTMRVHGFALLGANPGETGTLRVLSGAALEVRPRFALSDPASGLTIADQGVGQLEIRAGGAVNVGPSGFFNAGLGIGSRGVVIVDGAGSLLSTVDRRASFGQSASAELNITNGGQVILPAGIVLAAEPSAAATVTVSGAGSRLAGAEFLSVGGERFTSGGSAVVTIDTGAVVETSDLILWNGGRIELRGGTLTTSALSDRGGALAFSNGTLNVNGSFSIGAARLGEPSGGFVLLTPGRNLNVSDTLTVPAGTVLGLAGGGLSTGSLSLVDSTVIASALDLNQVNTLSGRGVVNADVNGTDVTSRIAAAGPLTLGRVGSTNGFDIAGTLDVGASQVVILDADRAQLGAATNLAAGGRLVTINGAELGPLDRITATGQATVGGDFRNDGTVVGPSDVDRFLSFNDNVAGSGSYGGNIEFLQGFSPGNSPARVQFEGNFRLSATAVLLIELAGLSPGTQFDQIVVGGNAVLGGELEVVLLDGFMLAAGDRFEILSIGGQRDGEFTGLGEGARVATFGNNNLFITYAGGDGNDVALFAVAAPVPEPRSVILLTIGLAAVTIRAWRKRRQTDTAAYNPEMNRMTSTSSRKRASEMCRTSH